MNLDEINTGGIGKEWAKQCKYCYGPVISKRADYCSLECRRDANMLSYFFNRMKRLRGAHKSPEIKLPI